MLALDLTDSSLLGGCVLAPRQLKEQEIAKLREEFDATSDAKRFLMEEIEELRKGQAGDSAGMDES